MIEWRRSVTERARLAAGLVACIGLGPVAQEVGAQTVRGRVFDAQTERPIANALVRLVERSGNAVAVTAADEDGRYQLTAPVPGTYRLRAEFLGYDSHESAPLEARGASDQLTIDLPMRPAPVPIPGVEITVDQENRRIRQLLGVSVGLLRVRPVRHATIQQHAARGDGVSGLVVGARVPNLQVQSSREGPCYQHRGRGCLPVFLDGARVNRRAISLLSLEMLSTVVILLPNEVIAYPEGAVHLYSVGFAR